MEPIYAEKIIQARKNAKEAQENEETAYKIEDAIEKGYVLVRYEKLELEEKSIMEQKASILLPKSFEKMPEELMQIKYPDPNRPECILSDEEGKEAITFHLEEGQVEEGDLEQIAELLKGEMKRLYPASLIEDEKTIGEGRERVCWFSFDIPLIDDQCCHVMFFREMKEGLLMGTFDCSRTGKKQWKPILKQLLGTIREDSQSDGTEKSIQ